MPSVQMSEVSDTRDLDSSIIAKQYLIMLKQVKEKPKLSHRLIPQIYNEQVITIKIMQIKDAVYEVNMESDHLNFMPNKQQSL